MTAVSSRRTLCSALALALLVPAGTASAQLRHHGNVRGRAMNRALPPGNPPPRTTGAAGPPPLGAAGPAPVGASGVQLRFPEHEPPHPGPGAGCVGEGCAALPPDVPPDALGGAMHDGLDGMDSGLPVE